MRHEWATNDRAKRRRRATGTLALRPRTEPKDRSPGLVLATVAAGTRVLRARRAERQRARPPGERRGPAPMATRVDRDADHAERRDRVPCAERARDRDRTAGRLAAPAALRRAVRPARHTPPVHRRYARTRRSVGGTQRAGALAESAGRRQSAATRPGPAACRRAVEAGGQFGRRRLATASAARPRPRIASVPGSGSGPPPFGVTRNRMSSSGVFGKKSVPVKYARPWA